ncbi:hypothetical protein ASC87_24565 [Rhizobacter sp. Root1221]|nr:hypothetical protein ASC87_24565 [Rhizobacter sp. Root1221]
MAAQCRVTDRSGDEVSPHQANSTVSGASRVSMHRPAAAPATQAASIAERFTAGSGQPQQGALAFGVSS